MSGIRLINHARNVQVYRGPDAYGFGSALDTPRGDDRGYNMLSLYSGGRPSFQDLWRVARRAMGR